MNGKKFFLGKGSLPKQSVIFFITFMLLMLAVLGTLYITVNTQEGIQNAESQRHMSYQIARTLRQSSDDLTNMARLFVITGEERFHTYFNDILNIRYGNIPRPVDYHLPYWDFVLHEGKKNASGGQKKSLKSLMIQQNFSLEEFASLVKSEEVSIDLAKLEDVAMNAAQGIFRDTSGMWVDTGKPDFEMARNIMFSDNYLEKKADIMRLISHFISILEERTRSELESLHQIKRIEIFLAIALCTTIFFATVFFIIKMVKNVLFPLSLLTLSAEKVREGDFDHYIDYEKNDEMGKFVSTFNSMLLHNKQKIMELESSKNILEKRQEALEKERRKSEELLLNVLPSIIANRMKSGEKIIVDDFAEVSVVFIDLVGFTKTTVKIGPKSTVNMLNEIFAMFDEKVELYKLEKIKTIGDAYMAVSGIPLPAADHAHKVAQFALSAREGFYENPVVKKFNLNIRIGIHSGSATAGIVGTKKFSYDLWGDVVNMASRLESASPHGKILVSRGFVERLNDAFEFSSLGEVELKGKGKIETYSLDTRKYENITPSIS